MNKLKTHIAISCLIVSAIVTAGASRIPSDTHLEKQSSFRSDSFSSTTFYIARNNPVAHDSNPGTIELPWKTISQATQAGILAPGDSVVIREGVYRESIWPLTGGTDENSRISFSSYPGELVIITGADVVQSGWTRQDSLWILPGYRPLSSYGDSTFKRTLVVVDGLVLLPVYRWDDLSPGTFHVEGTNRRRTRLIVFPDQTGNPNPDSHEIEIARRTTLFAPINPLHPNLKCGDPETPGWFSITGLVFRHAANRAQQGAVCTGSEGSVLTGNVVEWTNGLGIMVRGTGHQLRNNDTSNNGQAGIGGRCLNCVLDGNRSSYNNWKGHDVLWEAGGGKWVGTSNTRISNHTATGNRGPGIWFDIENKDNTIENSIFDNNELAGIFLEYKTVNTTVRNNVIKDTRRYRWSGAGILIQASSSNRIENNIIMNNDGAGIWLRHDDRADNGGNLIISNLLANNARVPGNDFSDISVASNSDAIVRSNHFDRNTYWHSPESRLTPFFFVRARDINLRYKGSDMEKWRVHVQGADQSVIAPRRPKELAGIENSNDGR